MIRKWQKCDIRKCISCNIGCAGNRIGFNRPIRCTVNPSVLEGDTYKTKKVNKNCNVVVIGGGTAGLEAACTAAEVGCNTFLLEEKETLGGLAAEISKIPAKKRLADFPHYLEHRAAGLDNLYIFTGTQATPDNIRKFHPNLIVNATGSGPLLPPIKGLMDNIDKEGGNVYSILGMIHHINDFPQDLEGKKVAVIGGGAVGLDVVEFFAARKADISIVYGFVCLGMRAKGQLYPQLLEAFADDDVEIINIGDSQRARRIIDGTMEGRNILYHLTQRGYLD